MNIAATAARAKFPLDISRMLTRHGLADIAASTAMADGVEPEARAASLETGLYIMEDGNEVVFKLENRN